MMTETAQRRCALDAMPDFELKKKFMEDDSKGKNRRHESTKIREIHVREEKRDPQLRKRNLQDPLSRRWSRRTKRDNTYRVLSLFNLHF